MKNSEIIHFIDRFCAHDEELDISSNVDLAYTILAHGYLYVKPGKSTEKFALKVIKALKHGAFDGFNNYLKDGYCIWPLEEWIRISMGGSAFKVARKMFDKKYFEEQRALLEADETFGESLLDKYLNLMNKEQLCTFMDEISYCRANYQAFSTFENESKITDDLNERCRKVNPSIPKTIDGLKYLSYKQNNPCYLFDCLSKEEIVSAIKQEIIWNKSLAGHVARMLYNTGSIGNMEFYIELISSYEHVFRGDIYKPNIIYETLNFHR